jgi:hypothetical protein
MQATDMQCLQEELFSGGHSREGARGCVEWPGAADHSASRRPGGVTATRKGPSPSPGRRPREEAAGECGADRSAQHLVGHQKRKRKRKRKHAGQRDAQHQVRSRHRVRHPRGRAEQRGRYRDREHTVKRVKDMAREISRTRSRPPRRRPPGAGHAQEEGRAPHPALDGWRATGLSGASSRRSPTAAQLKGTELFVRCVRRAMRAVSACAFGRRSAKDTVYTEEGVSSTYTTGTKKHDAMQKHRWTRSRRLW